ncbi:EAL domain-containing protein [Pararobbsia silviterrae]|uniref:EAL domain-containing protein n=1 Tax=Pararobbsia silviterrae TaxID=1792498 RepID=A0A494XU70_9BURK|nr:EAL domain-containing protein [Pararobbsia silviterrae]RKP53382.1 EAL domain-containing protein [Pararobbsia silviterrae]
MKYSDVRYAGRAGTLLRRGLEAYVLFPVFALLLLVSAWTSVMHLVGVEGDAAQAAAAASSRELADTYEAQLVRSLTAIDQTLKTVKYAYDMSGCDAIRQLHDNGLLPSRMVFDVAIVGADGALLASTDPHAHGNIAERPYFAVQKHRATDGAMPYVSEATGDPLGGSTAITFSRRLEDSGGRFAGIVLVSVSPAYFTSGYDSSRMGQHGLLAVIGTDDIVRAQQIGSRTIWGQHVPVDIESIAHAISTDTATVHPWDEGVTRYTNVRELHGFPLVAIVGLSQDEQLVDFHAHKRTYIWETALGSVMLIVLTLVLSRTSWQLALIRQRARQAQQTYYAASEGSIDAFFVLDCVRGPDGEIARFVVRNTNRRGVEVSGLPKAKLLGMSLDDAFPDSNHDGMFDEFVRVADTGQVLEREWIHRRPDGTRLWLYRQVVRVEDGVVAIMRDISARKGAELRRQEQNRVLEMIAAATPLAEVLDYLMRVLETQISGVVCATLMRSEDGKSLRVIAAPSLPDPYWQAVLGTPIGADAGPSGRAIHTHAPVIIGNSANNETVRREMIRVHVGDCQGCWAMPIIAPSGDALASLTLYVQDARTPTPIEADALAMATRIAGIAIERRLAEDRIRHMASHDALTGLPNRTQLGMRLNRALRQRDETQRRVSIVFIDLDNFKLINDSLGHHSGDDLLKVVAARMTNCFNDPDTVVRLGGDEFVVVLFGDSGRPDAVTASIERVRDAILQPVELAGQTYQITCSMGIASYPDGGTDAETLLKNADIAMYRAKALGRNNYQHYTAEMSARTHDRLQMQEQLRQALANHEFRLVYQPQVDLATETINGVEALVRWEHPMMGLVSPAQFIPLAEETGLIVPIGDWVLHEACKQNKAWQRAGMPPLTVSVNVSAHQFLHEEWVARVAHALEESGLDPRYLELELTESLIMRDLDAAVATMKELQRMGVRLSIDDFGTGYSSLSALKHFPIVRLKIDQSFVRGLPHDEDDSAIVTGIISLARRLNLDVIAEGVETVDQLDFLLDNDCHEIQGYLFSRPLPADQLNALLRERSTWSRNVVATDRHRTTA